MKRVFRLITALYFIFAVSLTMWVCGYDGRLQFNKGAVSLVCFGIAYRLIPEVIKHRQSDRRGFRFAYGISFLLVLTEIFGLWLWRKENTGLAVSGFPIILILIFCPWVMAAVLEPFFYHILKWSISGDSQRLSQKKTFIISWSMLTLACVPCLLAFYPGLYCYDMIWQWSQFAAGSFSTHHPLIHTIFASGLIELGRQLFGGYQKGLFLHSVIQTLIMTGSMAFAIACMVKWHLPKIVIVGTGCFFALFPFFPVLGISTTKDTVFGCLFLAAFVLIIDMERTKKLCKGRKLAAFTAVLVLCCLFRNNMIYGLMLMALCLVAVIAWRSLKRERVKQLVHICLISLAVIVISFLGFSALKVSLHAENGSKAEMLSAPMQQMARVYVHHYEELDEQDISELESFFDEQQLGRYKYYIADPVKAGINIDMVEAEKGKFLKLWLRLGRQYPAEYIEATLANTFGIWYFGGDSSCYMEYDLLDPFDDEHYVYAESKLPGVKEYYKWFQDENLHEYLPGISVIFYTSFYFWMIILCGWRLIIKRSYGHLFSVLFLLTYGATLIFAPCIIPRYCFGLMLCTPVLFVTAFSDADADIAGSSACKRYSDIDRNKAE